MGSDHYPILIGIPINGTAVPRARRVVNWARYKDEWERMSREEGRGPCLVRDSAERFGAMVQRATSEKGGGGAGGGVGPLLVPVLEPGMRAAGSGKKVSRLEGVPSAPFHSDVCG